jgi:hypothetical protein
MTDHAEILDFYRQPAPMTAADAGAYVELPRTVAGLTKVIHGLLLHEHWAPAYGQTLSDERRSQTFIRPVSGMLEHLAATGPLTVARAADQRLIGVCRHFSVLLASMLRTFAIPARARCGFGAYFEPGRFVDHWVTEYWNEAEDRWVLVDAQVDSFQAGRIRPDFDLLDVPRDRFVVAGDAWRACRAGEADPALCGIFAMNGLWFINGNIVRDVAALNKVEMQAWDCWGGMGEVGEGPDPIKLAYFDRLAELTHEPDAHFDELRRLYVSDTRLTVPPTVFNAVANRMDTL